LKFGEVFLKGYENPIEAAQSTNRYIVKYDSRRTHDSLGKKTPGKIYYFDSNYRQNQTKIC